MQRLKNAQEGHVVEAGVGRRGLNPKESASRGCGESALDRMREVPHFSDHFWKAQVKLMLQMGFWQNETLVSGE